jgi:hydrogenase-4 membrane subunit HyfE
MPLLHAMQNSTFALRSRSQVRFAVANAIHSKSVAILRQSQLFRCIANLDSAVAVFAVTIIITATFMLPFVLVYNVCNEQYYGTENCRYHEHCAYHAGYKHTL